MVNKKDPDALADSILKSKKYRSLYRPTVIRIVNDALLKYPEDKVEKAIRRRLHQIWGAYFIRPNFDKLLERIHQELEQGKPMREIIKPILRLQTSTNERIPILDSFYSRIFAVTGKPETIAEPACGLNSLTYFWMEQPVTYTGFDVDQEQINFINAVFKLANVNGHASVTLGDILELSSCGNACDMTLLLKVFPLLEHQQKGCSLDIIKKIESRDVVISYPTRSISGKNKGMEEFYSNQFEAMVSSESWDVKKLMFESELVFCVRK